MTNTLASFRQRHRELSHSFALVAPLGGGAVMALHALQQEAAQEPCMPSARTAAPEGIGPAAEAAAAQGGECKQGWLGLAWK